MSELKLQRLSAAFQRAVQQVLSRGLADERVRGLITVLDVRVLGDLTEAIVSVSILPTEHEELTMHGLRHAAGHIRREVSELVETRQVPLLRFELDHSLKRQASVLREINRAKEEREARLGPDVPAAPEGDEA